MTPTTKPIKDWPGYSARSDGQIVSDRRWRGNNGRVLAQFNAGRGYMRVHMTTAFGRRSISVHRLIAEAFLGPRPSLDHEVRHLDGNPLNNDASNLAWGTRQDNADDRERHGRTSNGAAHSGAIKNGLAWRKLAESGMDPAAIPALVEAAEKVLDGDYTAGTMEAALRFSQLRAALAAVRGEK